MTDFEARTRNTFNHPGLLPIWREMVAALKLREATTGTKAKAAALRAYKDAGARYRAKRVELGV